MIVAGMPALVANRKDAVGIELMLVSHAFDYVSLGCCGDEDVYTVSRTHDRHSTIRQWSNQWPNNVAQFPTEHRFFPLD
jgi:hypothetical protein